MSQLKKTEAKYQVEILRKATENGIYYRAYRDGVKVAESMSLCLLAVRLERLAK